MVAASAEDPLTLPLTEPPTQSPLFRATESERYLRQEQIEDYERFTGRSLVVFWGPISSRAILPLADAMRDITPGHSLDVMLTSPGGDGEAAKRLASMCHAGRSGFRVIVPDVAASAATLLALSAEAIVMSDTSALGPVDPQVFLTERQQYFPAKRIIEIVEELDKRTRDNPHAYGLYATLLADIDAIVYQAATAAMERSVELIPELLSLRNVPLPADQIEKLCEDLLNSAMHSATIDHATAVKYGLPIEYVEPQSDTWDKLWRLHTHYAIHLKGNLSISQVEGRRVSFRFGNRPI